jgi:hypothetical protein
MAKNPGPMQVPTETLKSVLGIVDVKSVAKQSGLAIVDSSLAEA